MTSTTQKTIILKRRGPCPDFASLTLAFALQLRKTTENPQSVRDFPQFEGKFQGKTERRGTAHIPSNHGSLQPLKSPPVTEALWVETHQPFVKLKFFPPSPPPKIRTAVIRSPWYGHVRVFSQDGKSVSASTIAVRRCPCLAQRCFSYTVTAKSNPQSDRMYHAARGRIRKLCR